MFRRSPPSVYFSVFLWLCLLCGSTSSHCGGERLVKPGAGQCWAGGGPHGHFFFFSFFFRANQSDFSHFIIYFQQHQCFIFCTIKYKRMALRVQLTSLYWHDFFFFFFYKYGLPFFLFFFSTDVELEHVSGDLLGITSTSPCTGNIPPRGAGDTFRTIWTGLVPAAVHCVCLCWIRSGSGWSRSSSSL